MSYPLRASVCLLAVLASTSLARAVQAPPPQQKTSPGGAQLGMLDARVNAKDVWQRAMSTHQKTSAAGLITAKAAAVTVTGKLSALKRQIPGIKVQLSSLTGAPSSVHNRGGALTSAAPGRASEDIVRGFLRANGELYGLSETDLADLKTLGDSPGGTSHLRMLRMEQRIDGRPVFQSETRFLLDVDGRLIKSVGVMVPHARSLASHVDEAALMPAPAAAARLLTGAGKPTAPASFSLKSSEEDGRILLGHQNPYLVGPVTARAVLFPLAPGVLVPAWSIVMFTKGEQDWYAIVDAENGEILWRKNMRTYSSTHDARFRVYVQADGVTPADSPAPASPNSFAPGSGTQPSEIAPTIVSMLTAMNPIASPDGWIDDCPAGGCTANETQTLGNNALACLDRTGGVGNNVCDTDTNSVLDGNGRPTGNPDTNGRNRDFLGTTPRDFETNFLPPPQGGNPEAGQTATGNGTAQNIFRRGIVTNLFYVANWYHDRLYALGFDEASGNFQQTNFSGMGLGGDRVLADAEDNMGVNNSNFATPPDGTSGRMQMYRFTGPTIDRDGDLDGEVMMHELTHGTSNRLIGNGAGLNWSPGGGMGEGWSDFVALSLLNNTNADNPNGHYSFGGYATYKLIPGFLDNYVYGIRRFPYTTDHSVNPLTWADVDDVTLNTAGGIAPSPIDFNSNGALEVHNVGEVWAGTLWDVRALVIADPAGANGDVPTGNHTMLQLTVDALKFTPIDPSFTDARDAFLEADCATNACSNETSIWAGFAGRGLGYGANSPYNIVYGYNAGHLAVHESFNTPFLDVVTPATDVVVDDTATNNNGAIDPGEAVKLNIKLTNPWRAASKAVTSATATLSSSTAGVTVYTASATYGAINPTATGIGGPFVIGVDSSVACGSPIDFTLTTVSNLGTTSTSFRLRVGGASGTDPVVTYTDTLATPLAIPDGVPHGVFTTFNVNDDLQIADLNFRIDSVTHTFTGDLTFELRSPAGVGTDFISLIDGLTDGGAGVNITNMVADDDLPVSAANDMVEAVAAQAPYTGSWLPVFNAPWPPIAGFSTGPDPVGNLSRYDGASTLGLWTVQASDQFTADTGTLNSWSMLVTPVHFACTNVVTAAQVSATQTVSGSFTVGGTVTYTVVLTNAGSGAQGDNAGHEFSETLPAGVAVTGVSATAGTAAHTGNAVTWDGSLIPLSGTVTVTITATINSGTEGTTISAQGQASFDSNNDGTNDATKLTDDPGKPGTADPTTFIVAGGAFVTGTKTVSGSFKTGGVVTYTILLLNSGAAATGDNPGNELTDTLPASLHLTGATATSGTASTTGNTANWNGSIPAGTFVTITITATVNAGHDGEVISNQASFAYDADGNGTNETTGTTDDPTVGGADDPTSFTVADIIGEVPTLSGWGLALLGVLLTAAGWIALRRRQLV
jgi:uncharacterized repeat protein (TIGR01451 family)